MIPYRKYERKALQGAYCARITAVEPEENTKYDPDKGYSTPFTLNITFAIEDRETGEMQDFTQKYVAPLTHDKGLFQQLLDILEELPDADGGEIDEQRFVGIYVIAYFEKNKKGYDTIIKVEKDVPPVKPVQATATKKTKPLNSGADLPF